MIKGAWKLCFLCLLEAGGVVYAAWPCRTSRYQNACILRAGWRVTRTLRCSAPACATTPQRREEHAHAHARCRLRGAEKKRFSQDAGAVRCSPRSHGPLADVSHWGAHWDAHGASHEPGLGRVRCAALPPDPSRVVPAARSTRSADARGLRRRGQRPRFSCQATPSSPRHEPRARAR